MKAKVICSFKSSTSSSREATKLPSKWNIKFTQLLITIMRFNWPRSAFYINKSRVARNSLLNSFRFERQRNAINFESFSTLLLCISISFMQMISDSVLILKFACRKEDSSRPQHENPRLRRRSLQRLLRLEVTIISHDHPRYPIMFPLGIFP